MSLRVHIRPQDVFMSTKTIGEDKIQKSIFDEEFQFKIGFWLLLGKMSSKNRKIS